MNNSDEPLSKRLKIAQNALHSVELIGINKEELLLDWFSKISVKSDSKEIWEGLNLCLNSQHFHNFRQSEINQDILHKLIKSISKSIKENKENDVKKSILECAKVILRNTAFKQFFKHDLSLFCTFLSTIITNVDEVEELNNILNDKSILDPKIFVKIDCFKIFLSNVLPTLFDVALKNNDETITNNVIKLLQKVSYFIFVNEMNFKNKFFRLYYKIILRVLNRT